MDPSGNRRKKVTIKKPRKLSEEKVRKVVNLVSDILDITMPIVAFAIIFCGFTISVKGAVIIVIVGMAIKLTKFNMNYFVK